MKSTQLNSINQSYRTGRSSLIRLAHTEHAAGAAAAATEQQFLGYFIQPPNNSREAIPSQQERIIIEYHNALSR